MKKKMNYKPVIRQEFFLEGKPMNYSVNQEKKYVSLWLSNAENRDEEIHEKLTPFCQHWKSQEYRVVIFKSGQNDLACLTKELLARSIQKQAHYSN